MVLPKPFDWRLLPQGELGQIQGIHTMRGTAVATNGIHVAIVCGNTIHIGHLDWFITDEQAPMVARAKAVDKPAKVKSSTLRFDIFAGFSLD